MIEGDYEYKDVYTSLFTKNYSRYKSMQDRIDQTIIEVLSDPYFTSELLGKKGKVNLRGCRSKRIGRNFRLIFTVCEECRYMWDTMYCFCEGLEDKTVVFLTVGTH